MTHFHDRHAGLFPPESLDQKRVLIAGCGSLGGTIALHLARAGVTAFSLVDFDTVAESNLCRTVYVAGDVGSPKVQALARHLAAVRSGIAVDACSADIQSVDDPTVDDWIDSAAVVVAATDHPGVQARLGALSYHRRPAVFPGVYEQGVGGEVLYTVPELTPCYHCVLGRIRGAGAPRAGRTDYGVATGQLAAEPALGIDIAHVAVCASKVALALLLQGQGAAVSGIVKPDRTLLFVGNRAEWIWREPFETVWARADRLDACVCRLGDDASTADVLDDIDQEAPLPWCGS